MEFEKTEAGRVVEWNNMGVENVEHTEHWVGIVMVVGDMMCLLVSSPS